MVPSPLPAEVQPSQVHDMNGAMNEEEAFAAALRPSVEEEPPPPVLKSTSMFEALNSIAHTNLPFEEAPLALCCPITLALLATEAVARRVCARRVCFRLPIKFNLKIAPAKND